MISSQLRSHNNAKTELFASPHILNWETSVKESPSKLIRYSVQKPLSSFHSCMPEETSQIHSECYFLTFPLTVVPFCALSLQPLAQWWRLLPKDAAKMPESAWKLVFYTMSWSYSTYLLFFTSYSFFHDPPSVFYSKIHNRVDTVLMWLSSFV